MIFRILFPLAVFCQLFNSSCSTEKISPNFAVKIHKSDLPMERIPSMLDATLLPCNFTRFGAAPGLKELKNRDVLYYEYKLLETDKIPFLVFTDLVDEKEIDVRLYYSQLGDSSREKVSVCFNRLAEIMNLNVRM